MFNFDLFHIRTLLKQNHVHQRQSDADADQQRQRTVLATSSPHVTSDVGAFNTCL